MAALRSRRLESVLGAPLDELKAKHLHSLIAVGVQEAFDLDFKQALYGNSDRDRRSLAGDVAALANTGGGVILLGVEEDDQARATAAPGVDITDAEVARMRQVVASLVAPMPVFDILSVVDPGAGTGTDGTVRGFIVVAVPRSSAAPHAVLINDALRFPARNGATTRYLSEPEVATAYRNRFASAQRQAERVEEIEQEAIGRLAIDDRYGWLIVSLVPDLPGDLRLSEEAFRAFEMEVRTGRLTITGEGHSIYRTRVGRRRLLADGTGNYQPEARWISLELHTDGSGVFAMAVGDLNNRDGRAAPADTDSTGTLKYQVLADEGIAAGILPDCCTWDATPAIVPLPAAPR